MNNKLQKLILTFCVFTSVSIFAQNDTSVLTCPKILGIAHVGYFSSDFNKAKDFYGNYLELTPTTSRKNKDGVEDMIKYKVGDIQSIELFTEKKPDAPRFYHFAVLVENSEAMRLYLVSKGIRVPKEPIVNYANYFSYDFNNCICEMVDVRKYKVAEKNSTAGIARHIEKVGFIVPDMVKALKYYCDILGFRETGRTKDEKNTIVVTLRIGNSADSIELTQYESKLGVKDESYSNYFTLQVESLQNAEDKLKKNKLADGTVVELKNLNQNGTPELQLSDRDGLRIILREKQK